MKQITDVLKIISDERADLLSALSDLQKFAEQEAKSGYRFAGLGLADKGVKIAEINAKLEVLHKVEFHLLAVFKELNAV